MAEDCIFCRIVSGNVPSYNVYEDADFIGFLDIRPLTRGNCLLIPKKHYHWTYEVPNFGEYFEAARKIGVAAQKAFGAEWVCFLTLGLEVPHAHIRGIPRYKQDLHGIVVDINKWETFPGEEMKEIAAKIAAELE